ncbi:MAG: hypothetical protein IPM69_10635 [Ignavibacteria bacterium]|nr:hypothetical protein [Ignavibacteria bacterium]
MRNKQVAPMVLRWFFGVHSLQTGRPYRAKEAELLVAASPDYHSPSGGWDERKVIALAK